MHTLRDFLEASIENEKKIRQLYEQGREITKLKTTKKCLGFLLKDEDRHIEILQGILENELYDLDCEIPNNKVFKEALEAYGIIERECCEDSTVEEILNIALKREFHAQKQYEALAKICKVPEMATLLEHMAEEDEEHRQLIDREYKSKRGLMGEEF